jgi:short chain dehydrogenase
LNSPIKRQLATDDCRPKFRQTPKKQPGVKPYSPVIQRKCNGTQRAIVQASNLDRIENGFKQKGSVMKNKVVLITGGLTGIGRATALAFAQEGASIVVPGDMRKKAKSWLASSANSVQKLNLCGPMCAMKKMCAP